MIVGLPSGIGDCSWAVSKLRHVGPLHYQIADGWPYRTVPYFELLPECAKAEYGEFQYQDIIGFEQQIGMHGPMTWAELSAKGYGRVLIEPNLHLERGKPLADWLPDLPTDFHYPMVTTREHQERAAHLLEGLPRPLWGVSAASYRGSEAWKTWGADEWQDFLRRFHAEAGGTILLLGGSWDDLTSTLADGGYYDIVGKTSVGAMVEVLKCLDGYLGFSSGMGVLNTVLYGKTFMCWPDHQAALSTSWADPVMLENGAYQASLWRKPAEVFGRVKAWLRLPEMEERRALRCG